VKIVPGQGAVGFDGFHVLVGDLDAGGVGGVVEFGADGEPGAGIGQSGGIERMF